MEIISIKNKEKISEIVDIHLNTFVGFFLTDLGKGFLKNLYIGYLEDKNSGILIAVEKNKVIGFLAYSNDYSNFYKNLLKKKIVKFGFYSLISLLKHPIYFNRIIGAFGKSEEVKKSDKYVELASIGVESSFEGKGVGTQLINQLKKITDFNKYKYISLETDAKNNEKVNSFYKSNNFKLFYTYKTKQGRLMNEYHYTNDD